MSFIQEKHLKITLDHMRREMHEWLNHTHRKSDLTTLHIIKLIRESEISIMAIKTLMGRDLSDDEVSAHIARGWSYLKAIYGHDKAVEVVNHAGACSTIASAVMLDHFASMPATDEHMQTLANISYVPTLSSNIVEILAEHNGETGESVGLQLAAIVPMTDVERRDFEKQCQGIDYSVKTVH